MSNTASERTESPLLARLLRVAVRRPLAVLGAWTAVVVVASLGVLRVQIDTTTDSVLNKTSDAWTFYQHSMALFGSDEVVVIAFEADRPFDPDTLERVAGVTGLLESQPGIRRVDSLSTVPLVRVLEDGSLDLRPALEQVPPRDPQAARELAARVRSDRIAPRNLVSDDGRVFAVNALLDPDSGVPIEAQLGALRGVLEGERGWISGVPVFREAVNTRTRSEVLLFVPVTVSLIGSLLFTAFGSLRAILIPLSASAAGTWLTMATLGAISRPMTFSTMMLPTVLLALGCAYTMHLLTAARGVANRGELEIRLAEVLPAVALSGLTTAMGFLAIATVRIEAVQELGALGALGVMLVLAAVLTLVPAALALWPLAARRAGLDRWVRGPLRSRLLRALHGRSAPVLVVWTASMLGVGIGIPSLRVDTDVTRWFPHGSHVRDSYEEIRTHLSGISPMNVVVESEGEARVTSPGVVEALSALTEYLEGLPEVGRAVSLADPLRQLHEGFVGSPDAGLPGEEALIEQYLLLLESEEIIHDVVTDDRTGANIFLRVDQNGSSDLLRVAEQADRWWSDQGVAGLAARATGVMFQFASAGDEIARGQLRGLLLALGAIFIVFLAIFRKLRWAGIALIPNLIPLLAVFGFMGLAAIPLDAGTVTLGTLALGIAVDDTIHVMVGYRDRLSRGLSTEKALHEALERVLPALLYTTLAIGVGFAVLGLSEFTLIRNFGIVSSAMVALCYLADVTLLPSLLLRIRI